MNNEHQNKQSLTNIQNQNKHKQIKLVKQEKEIQQNQMVLMLILVLLQQSRHWKMENLVGKRNMNKHEQT